jgi:DNA primase
MAAPVIARIRDTALRPEYARMLAGWLGMDPKVVSDAIASAKSQPAQTARPVYAAAPDEDAPPPRVVAAQPDMRRVEHRVEREALKAVIQQPEIASAWYAIVEDAAFTFEPYLFAHQAVMSALNHIDPAEVASHVWIEAIMNGALDDTVRTTLSGLLVEPMNVAEGETFDRYVTGVIAKLQELDAVRRINDLKGRLQRLDSEADPEVHAALFNQLLALETHRRALSDHARGL